MDHTPGSWKRVTEHPVIPGKIRSGNCTLAEVRGFGSEACANAALMAAAPELLETLREMVRMYEEVQPCGGYQGVYDGAVSAIAKAEGK
jgi:hypothetical protein